MFRSSTSLGLFLVIVALCNILLCDAYKFYLNCDDNPCQHGQCIDLYRKTAYRCDCADDWQGENCDQGKLDFWWIFEKLKLFYVIADLTMNNVFLRN